MGSEVSGGVRGRSTGRRSVVIAGWTLVSRVTGLLRILVVGALMGPTFLANVFQAGYVLPNIVFSVMAGPVLAMVVVPVLVRALGSGGPRAADVLGRIAGRVLAIALVGAAILAVLAPALAWTLVAGVPGPERAGAWALTLVLVLFVVPQVPLYAAASLAVAAQQARGRFALAAAAPAVESVGVVFVVAGVTRMYGGGLDVGQAPLEMMVLLGLGSTGAVVLHAALQLYGAARTGLPVRPRRGWRGDVNSRDAVRRLARSVPVPASSATASYALNVVAATVPGGVLVLQLSMHVYYALSYVGGRAVAMAALPDLAACPGDDTLFGQRWRRGLYLALVAATPPMCLLVAFAQPTATLLVPGEFQGRGLGAALAVCLAVAAVAQLVGGVHDLGRQALFARLDDPGPRRASLLGLGTTALVGFCTLLLPVPDARLVGLLCALLVGEAVGAATVLVRLRRAIRPEVLVGRGTRVVLVAAAAMVPILAASMVLAPRAGGSQLLAELAIDGVFGLFALAAFAGVLTSLPADGESPLVPDPSIEPRVVVGSLDVTDRR